MPRDKTTSHKKVLAAAREEFAAYGFENASMRRIGKRCGMTAAGLYRHCRNKEDLFRELVTPAAERLDAWLEARASRSDAAPETGGAELWKGSEIDMMREIVYPHMEEYRLLLTGSGGTGYSGFLHDLTVKHQKKLAEFLPVLREKGHGVPDLDEKALHLLLSAYTTALFEPVIHGYTEEEAYRYLETVEAFFLPGWKQLLGI